MDYKRFINFCKKYLKDYYKKEFEKVIEDDDIYVVWMCKTLQNNKALLSTVYHDHMYFEFTHNGDKGEIYLDAYKKEKNVCLTLSLNSANC